jgi:endonuclease/exonuclease/phosphatase (EEP) superfamily protein YafD
LLVAAANAWPLLPYLLPGAIDAHAGEPSARIMFVNVRVHNDDYEAVRELVAVENPDIVGFAEVDDAWIEGLWALNAGYPHSVQRAEPDAHGLALFSRFPIRELETSPYIQDGILTAIIVDVEMLSTHTSLYLTHPNSPVSPGLAALRNVQLESLAEKIRADRNREQILFGDLNTTPWSPHYARLEKQTGLVNAAAGRGYWPTWPTWPTWTGGLSMLKIPIDHCLLSDGFHVQSFRTGADVGSDHLPVIVDIAVPAQHSSAAAERNDG